MPKPNARLTMRLSPVSSNQEVDRYMSLVIEDVTSGRTIAAFELLGQHLLDLLSSHQVGGVDGLPAWLIEPQNRAALGKRSFVVTRYFPMSQYNEDTVERWACRNGPPLGAHEVRTRINNGGQIVALFTYYVDVAEEDEFLDVTGRCQATLDHLPPPAADKPNYV